jgi:hypothetical protein
MSAGTGSTSEARPSYHVTPAMSASEATFAPSKIPAITEDSRNGCADPNALGVVGLVAVALGAADG